MPVVRFTRTRDLLKGSPVITTRAGVLLALGGTADLPADEIAELSGRYVLEPYTEPDRRLHVADVTDLQGLLDADATRDAQAVTLAQIGAALGVQGLDASAKAPRDYVHTNELATTFTLVNPAPAVVLSGSFVAKTSSVPLDVSGTVRMAERGGFHCTVTLFYGDNATIPAGTMVPATQATALGTGVTKVRLGSVGAAYKARMGGSVLLTGLTVGHTYRYEVALGVVGYAASTPTSSAGTSSPSSVAVSKTLTPFPDSSWIVVTRNTDSTATVIQMAHGGELFANRVQTLVTLPGSASIGRVAITPDGSKAVITNQQAGTVTVLNTGAALNAASNQVAPTIQGTYTLPAGSGTPAPYGVAITPDGTKAYITILSGTDAGKIVPMTISSGAFGTAIVTGTQPYHITIDATATYAYVSHQTGGEKVVKLRLSDGVSVATRTLAAGQIAAGSALSPDGTILWVVTAGTTLRLLKVNVSDLSDAASPVTLSYSPTSVAVFSDGQGLLVSSNTTTENQIKHFLTPAGAVAPTEYVTWVNRLGSVLTGFAWRADEVVIDPNGGIYATSLTNKSVNNWFGGVITVQPGNDFQSEELRVRVLGAA